MRCRSLALKRDTLTDLTATDLGTVVAGALLSGPTCPVLDCVSDAACFLTVQPRRVAP